MTDYTYVGAELDLFATATNWKSYVRRQLSPYIGRDVLEVGAGFGGTTRMLCGGDHDTWTYLEPDPALAGRLADSIRSGDLPRCCPGRGRHARRPAGGPSSTRCSISTSWSTSRTTRPSWPAPPAV